MNLSEESVEEKIRRALETPGTEVEVELAPVKILKSKKKNNLSKYYKLFLASFILAFFYLTRYDSSINLRVTSVVLALEKVTSTELSVLRKLFAVKLKLNAEEFENLTKNNQIVIAKMLLDLGLDVNSTNSAGDTLLIIGLKQKNPEIVSTLLSKGANPNLPNSKGEYPLKFSMNSKEFVDVLVKAGADINARDLSQKTYLINSIENNNLELARVLVQSGADPNLQDLQGKTALHHAVDKKQKQAVDFLKSVGADQNISDKTGSKPINDEKKQEAVEQKTEPVKYQPPTISASSFTGVRVMGKVEGVWENGNEIVLKQIRAQVRNVGEVQANNVSVKVRVPGVSEEIVLQGPTSLPPYTTVTFTASPELNVYRAGDLKSTVTCENCHR